jgi:hypothetical protein
MAPGPMPVCVPVWPYACGPRSKTAKYQLRDGRVEEGAASYLLFAKARRGGHPRVVADPLARFFVCGACSLSMHFERVGAPVWRV